MAEPSPVELARSPTVAHLWRGRVEATPSALAFEHRHRGTWVPVTWRQADARVRRIAAGLLALGIDKGARVAILAETRLEWILCDFAILCAGAASCTLYPSSTPEACTYILEDAGCVAIFVERASMLGGLPELPGLRHRIVIEPDGELPEGVVALSELEGAGAAWLDRHPEAVDARIDTLGPGDLATLIYTSGTTGPPKGVMLVHDNWMFQAEALSAHITAHLEPGDKQYLFLPLAHAFGKICELISVVAGVPTAVCGELDVLVEGLQHTRPTLVAAVPRVFEKIHLQIEARARRAGPRRHQIFTWAVGISERVARERLAGRPVGPRLALSHQLADRLVLRRLRDALGGRIRAFVSGGAPLSEELARFFYAAGMTILEGYGLTETSAGAVSNQLDDFAFGTVGRPLPGCEIQIADDGEILIRGRNVMRGYWNRPEATAGALTPEGWLHTGDLGQLGPDGRLRVTGRIKDLIVTAGGKNIAPQVIEHRLKAACPWLAEVVIVGDRRPCCVALAWIDADATAAWAESQGLAARTHAQLSAEPRVRALIQEHVDQLNATLASYETLKQIHLVAQPLTDEPALLTPSLKLRRAAVAERYAEQIEALYARR